MKNKTANILSYSGIVTLSRQVGKKKVVVAQASNSGGASLFSFLADCLAGNLNSENVPKKIMLINREKYDDDTYIYTSASGFIFLRSPAEIKKKMSGECCVRYSFVVPRDVLENITNIDTLGLGLYSNNALEADTENFVAFCPTNVNIGQINSSLLVDWDLIISNATASLTKTAG